jgi:hypothetical protein
MNMTDCCEGHAIVSRIWKQLGSPTYEQLAGRDIHDMIAEKDAEIATLKAKVALQLVALTKKNEQVRELGEAGRLQSIEVLDLRAQVATLRNAIRQLVPGQPDETDEA